MQFERVTLGEWTDALLSGEYEQCYGQAREKKLMPPFIDDYSYCALGVAFQLFCEKNNLSWDTADSSWMAYFLDEDAKLANHKLSLCIGNVMHLNDLNRLTFPEIAKELKSI